MTEILIIDDERDQCDILRDIATSLGHRATIAARSLDAVALYQSVRPSLIILDMVMPGADGFEVLKALGESGCTTPVLLVSGFNPRYLESAQAIASHYGIAHLTTMRKPLHVAEVRRYLETTLPRAEHPPA